MQFASVIKNISKHIAQSDNCCDLSDTDKQ